MWSARCRLFMRQTGSRIPILEVCKIRFWQFRDCTSSAGEGWGELSPAEVDFSDRVKPIRSFRLSIRWCPLYF